MLSKVYNDLKELYCKMECRGGPTKPGLSVIVEHSAHQQSNIDTNSYTSTAAIELKMQHAFLTLTTTEQNHKEISSRIIAQNWLIYWMLLAERKREWNIGKGLQYTCYAYYGCCCFCIFLSRYLHFKELVLFPTQCHTAVTAVLFFLTKVYNTRTVSCVMLFLLWSTKLSLSPNRAYLFLHPFLQRGGLVQQQVMKTTRVFPYHQGISCRNTVCKCVHIFWCDCMHTHKYIFLIWQADSVLCIVILLQTSLYAYL